MSIDLQHHRLSGVHGANEQQTEPYLTYGDGVAQSATRQSAKSASGAAGSASWQAGTARRL